VFVYYPDGKGRYVSNPWREAIEVFVYYPDGKGRYVSNPWREAIEGREFYFQNWLGLFPILGGRLLKVRKNFRPIMGIVFPILGGRLFYSPL